MSDVNGQSIAGYQFLTLAIQIPNQKLRLQVNQLDRAIPGRVGYIYLMNREHGDENRRTVIYTLPFYSPGTVIKLSDPFYSESSIYDVLINWDVPGLDWNLYWE